MQILGCVQTIAVTTGLLLSSEARGAFESPREGSRVPAQRSVLVLNIIEASYPQDDLRIFVGNALSAAGAQLVEPTTLTPVARSCEESSCMRLLAANYRVDTILTVRIERTTDEHLERRRDVSMWLYDTRDESKLVRDFCRPDQLEDCLGDMAKRLLGLVPLAAAVPPPSPPAPAVKEATQSLLHRRLPPSSPRARAALGLGILSLGTLAAAISLHALHGMPVTDDGQGNSGYFVNDFEPLFVPLYTSASALALGTALTVFLPSKK